MATGGAPAGAACCAVGAAIGDGAACWGAGRATTGLLGAADEIAGRCTDGGAAETGGRATTGPAGGFAAMAGACGGAVTMFGAWRGCGTIRRGAGGSGRDGAAAAGDAAGAVLTGGRTAAGAAALAVGVGADGGLTAVVDGCGAAC